MEGLLRTQTIFARPIPRPVLPRISGLVWFYLIYAVSVLFFYLISPTIVYLILWERLPKIGLSIIYGLLLIPAFGLRLLLLLTRQMGIRTRHLAAGYLLLVWISILQLIWFPYASTQVGSQLVLSHMAFTFIAAWMLWLGGEALGCLIIQRPRFTRTLVITVYLGLALVIVDGVIKAFGLYGRAFFLFQNPVSLELYNYLGLADSVAVTGLLLLGLLDRDKLYQIVAVYISTVFLLFLVHSRNSFYCFILAGLLVATYKFEYRQKQQFLLALLGISVVMVFLIMLGLLNLGDVLLFQRFTDVFTGTDPSMQKRWELLAEGLNILKENWLLGYFMGEVVEIGRGSYIHNWLSFWVAYGIGPFLLSLWLLFSLLYKVWRQCKGNSLAPLGLGLMMFIILSISLARSYIWPYFWLGLSLSGSALLQKGR